MKKQEKVHVEIEMPTYTGAELDEFSKWLDQFRNAKTVVDKKGVSHNINPIDMQEAMVTFGALKKKDHLGIPTYSIILKVTETDGYGHVRGYERPTMMDLFWHKYEAWARRNYAVRMEAEAYQKIAEESFPAEPDFPVDLKEEVIAEKMI